MAEAAETLPSNNCGFCLRTNESLTEPKVLPCKHVHCKECLMSYHTIHHTVQCPLSTCSQVFDVSIDSLPSIDASEQEVPGTQTSKEDVRTCAIHEDLLYNSACINCLSVFCADCLPKASRCANDDEYHKMVPLEFAIETELERGLEEMSAEMLAREEEFESLFKYCTRSLAEHEQQTLQMVQTLSVAQEKSGDQRYEKLIEELKLRRQSTTVAIAEFMEEVVLPRWTFLSSHRYCVQAAFKYNSQADIVSRFSERKAKSKKLLDEEMPELVIRNIVELKSTDDGPDVKFEIVSFDDTVIDSEYGLSTYYPLPQSMTMLRSVKVSVPPISLCHYKGMTYVGLCNNTVAQINGDYEVRESFIRCPGQVESISVHKDKIYTLVLPSTGMVHTVCVYDMAGDLEREWSHSCDISYFCNALSLVSDQLVIADQPNRRITVYTLEGEVVKHLPCPQIEGVAGGITHAVDDSSVVVSRNNSVSEAFRLHLGKGDVMWSCGDVRRPESIASYGRKYVLVADCKRTVKILNVKSGAVVAELSDETGSEYEYIYGLETFNRTLVAAQYISVNVVFYKLNS